MSIANIIRNLINAGADNIVVYEWGDDPDFGYVLGYNKDGHKLIAYDKSGWSTLREGEPVRLLEHVPFSDLLDMVEKRKGNIIDWFKVKPVKNPTTGKTIGFSRTAVQF